MRGGTPQHTPYPAKGPVLPRGPGRSPGRKFWPLQRHFNAENHVTMTYSTLLESSRRDLRDSGHTHGVVRWGKRMAQGARGRPGRARARARPGRPRAPWAILLPHLTTPCVCPESRRSRRELSNKVLYVIVTWFSALKWRCRGQNFLPGLRPGPRGRTGPLAGYGVCWGVPPRTSIGALIHGKRDGERRQAQRSPRR